MPFPDQTMERIVRGSGNLFTINCKYFLLFNFQFPQSILFSLQSNIYLKFLKMSGVCEIGTELIKNILLFIDILYQTEKPINPWYWEKVQILYL